MGAYSPLPWAPAGLVEEVLRDVLQPTVDEMARRGTPFAGLLYAGLALTSRGVRVIEFNARFGDPETQVVLARLGTPIAGVLHAAATGRLAEVGELEWSEGAAVTVVVAAEGYPGRRWPVAWCRAGPPGRGRRRARAARRDRGRRRTAVVVTRRPGALGGGHRRDRRGRPAGGHAVDRSRWPARTTALTLPRPSTPTSRASVAGFRTPAFAPLVRWGE